MGRGRQAKGVIDITADVTEKAIPCVCTVFGGVYCEHRDTGEFARGARAGTLFDPKATPTAIAKPTIVKIKSPPPKRYTIFRPESSTVQAGSPDKQTDAFPRSIADLSDDGPDSPTGLVYKDFESTGVESNDFARCTVNQSSGEILGVAAIIDIPRGTRILTEEPYFSIQKPANGLELLAALSSPNSDQLTLTTSSEILPPLCAIWANAFDTDSSISIFLQANHINHSCIPNCQFSWNKLLQRLTVQAVRNIPRGQEITISYGPQLLPRVERQKAIFLNWDFTCACPACQPDTAFGQASELRRQLMFEIDQQIDRYNTLPQIGQMTSGAPDALPGVLRLIDLLLEEGIVNGELWRAYDDAIRIYEVRGRRGRALVYAGKKIEVLLDCVGGDSELVRDTIVEMRRLGKRGAVRRMRRYEGWGVLGGPRKVGKR